MKRRSTTFPILLTGLLLFAAALVFTGSRPVSAATKKVSKATVTDGWDGDRYYQNGSYLKGWQDIGKKTYYFNKWGRKQTGIQLIKKKYYFFTTTGALVKTSRKIQGVNYYLNDKGHLEAYGVGKTWYYPSGKKMTAAQQLDCITFRRARRWLNKLTKPSQTDAQKLLICFKWVKDHGYHKRRSWSYTEDWPARYANDHFLNTGGCCRSDGAAFAYLARAIGYTDVYVCQDGKTEAAHCWAQINGKVYDPLFASRVNGMNRYYGGTYKETGLWLINKQRVAIGFE